MNKSKVVFFISLFLSFLVKTLCISYLVKFCVFLRVQRYEYFLKYMKKLKKAGNQMKTG